MLLQMLLLCIAVSFDGLGAGISYGSRNICIPFFPRLIISLFSAFAMAAAMFLGWFLSRYISPEMSTVLGGTILILIGTWVVRQGQRKDSSQGISSNNYSKRKWQNPVIHYAIYRFSAFFKILSIDPREADLDGSGSISPGEAFLLGLALASDAFGAGIGVAMSGFNPWMTSLTVGISKYFLLSFGFWVGLFFQRTSIAVPAHFLAGGILILLGIFNIL